MTAFDARIEAVLAPFRDAAERLMSLAGIVLLRRTTSSADGQYWAIPGRIQENDYFSTI